MDTRVLTLFDDEDFFPQEEPRKKAKKEPLATTPPETAEQVPDPVKENEETKVIAETGTVTEDVVVIPAEITAEKTDVPEEEPPVDDRDTETTAEISTSFTDEHDSPIPEVDGNAEEIVSAEQEEHSGEIPEEDVDEISREETAAADEELNKQILSELIQADYTSLIHRDYPFDLNQAAVVAKAKPAARTEAEAEEIKEEEEEDNDVFEEITPLPEWNLDKKYYSIGEVAQLFAVNTSHIRFWTNEFKLKPRTTRKGDRLYNPKDIAELRLIHHLVKEKKHTIKGAKEKLKAGKTDVNSKLDLKDSLISLRDTLLQIKAQL